MSVTRAGLAPLIALVALGALLVPAEAQQAPPAPAPAPAATPAAAPSLNILVVDVQALLQNAKSAKMVRQQIEQKRGEYQKEMSAQEGALRQEHDTLQRQQSSLSAEAFNQKGREFQQKLNDFDKSMQSKRQILEKANSEALEKINEVMLKIIADIAKDRKANLVFLRSELVLFDQNFEISDEVQQKLDEQLPTLTVDFAAPVAANAPNGSNPPAAQTPAAPAQPAPKKKK
jgi:Skp family chaperone for outer membrane proteins